MPRNKNKTTASQRADQCAVCSSNPAKYRCPNCPVRYCSVPCYKQHKAVDHPELVVSVSAEAGPSQPSRSINGDLTKEADDSAPHVDSGPDEALPQPTSLEADGIAAAERHVPPLTADKASPRPLRPLSSLSWPPEPDEAIFTDPLRREDPKPLRHAELLRIAESADLRHLLSSTSLPSILRALDALPTPGARSAMLSRCLSIDPISLSATQSGRSADLLSQREGSPPPLEDLIRALARSAQGDDGDDGAGGVEMEAEKGFWIGRESQYGSSGDTISASAVQRVWIGPEERKIMRIFAGLVCRALDGGQGDAWGEGGLAWEV